MDDFDQDRPGTTATASRITSPGSARSGGVRSNCRRVIVSIHTKILTIFQPKINVVGRCRQMSAIIGRYHLTAFLDDPDGLPDEFMVWLVLLVGQIAKTR